MSSKKNTICPYCGRNIRKTDKFCPFCGKKVIGIEKNIKKKEQKSQEPATTVVKEPEPEKVPIKEEEIPENVLFQLELRSKIELIDSKLTEIRNQIEQLALKLTGDDTEGIEDEVKKLGEKINKLKEEKRSLESDLVDLPFEELQKKKADIESRIAKLQNAFSLGEVSESAYKRLREEYEEKTKYLENKFAQQKVKINIWVRNMRLERDKMIENLELLKARHIAGEYSDSEYEERREKLKNNISKLETNIKILNKYV